MSTTAETARLSSQVTAVLTQLNRLRLESVQKSGDTMRGDLYLTGPVGGDNRAATRQYVLDQFAGVSTVQGQRGDKGDTGPAGAQGPQGNPGYEGLNSALPIVKAVATTNISPLSGYITLDTVACASGDSVLLTAQSNPVYNGLWQVQPTGWARDYRYTSGSVVSAGFIVWTEDVGSHGASFWYATGSSSIIVDTTATGWSPIDGKGKVALNSSDTPDYLDNKLGAVYPLTATDLGGVRTLAIGAAASGNTALIYDPTQSAWILSPFIGPVAAMTMATGNTTLSGLQTLNGYTLLSDDIVLLNGQSTQSQNGLWVAASGGWTRLSPFFSTTLNVRSGLIVSILKGSYANSLWGITSNVTVDSTNHIWSQVGGSSTVTSIAASDITSGILALVHGGTGADLSATGGTSQYVKQISSGAALTVGVIAGTDLPSPSATTLGGVKSLAATASQWINQISTTGVPSATQPAFTDISGSVAASQMPALTGDVTTVAGAVATTLAPVNSNVGSFTNVSLTVNAKGLITAAASGSSGTPPTIVGPTGFLTWTPVGSTYTATFAGALPVADGGTGANLSTTGGTGYVLQQSSTGANVTVGAITVLGTIGTGIWNGTAIAVTHGGTGANLSATGGSNEFVKQTTSGGAFTVATITGADLAPLPSNGNFLGYAAGAPAWQAISATPTTPYATWASGSTYAQWQVVLGSDNNLYVSQVAGNIGNTPTTDLGTNWKLWVLQANLSRQCGTADFLDVYGTPVGTLGGQYMTPGAIAGLAFFASAVATVSPGVATATLTQTLNPTFVASATGSTTTIKSTINIPVGASLQLKTVGAGGSLAVGTTTTVSSSAYSSPTFTLTVPTMPHASVAGDVWVFTPVYGASVIPINLPTLGPNFTFTGSTSTVVVPATAPVWTTGTVGSGGFGSATYYAAIGWWWTDSTGTAQFSMPGQPTSFGGGAGGTGSLIVPAQTLPTGVAGYVVYVSTTLNGAMSKVGSTVTGGGSTTITSSTLGTAAPTTNPAPATYPVAMQFAGGGISAKGSPGLTVSGLYVYGNASGIGITETTSTGAIITDVVVSNFSIGISLTDQLSTLSNVQSDKHVNYGLITQQSQIGVTACAFLSSAFGIIATSGGNVYAPGSYAGWNTTYGIDAQLNSFVRFYQANANALPVYGSTNSYTPGPNATGSGNSYVDTSS